MLPPLLFASVLAAASLFPEARAADRPNILFLFADDQRADAVGAYGNDRIDTPHIDSLVRRGFSFRQAYCMGSIHGAVCQPSRAMLMSGRTLYRVPMNLKDTKTLPEVLRGNGYTTFGTGKWHNGKESFARSFDVGRSVFHGGMSDHLKVPAQNMKDDGTFEKFDANGTYSSELFASAAIEFLVSYKKDAPFFAYVSFTAPHDPRNPPEEYRQRYYERNLPLPANFLPQHPFHNGWMTGRDEALADWPRTESVVRDQLAEYYGLITHLDDQVGRILAALEETGLLDNTIVVYTADHGLAVGSHGLLGKQSVYEHSMKTPMVIAGPGIPAGKSSNALVYLYDLAPTLWNVTDTPSPEGVEGKSLAPLWKGEEPRVRDTLFLTYEDIQRAVRDDRYKLIRYPKIDRTQLFDLQEDPQEMNDLIASPQHQKRIAAMTELMRQWQRAVDDKAPLVVAEPESAEIDLSDRQRKPDGHQPPWIVEKYFKDASGQ